MKIGPYALKSNVILAPMAGITDRPFRQLCREFGAALAVSEMVSANPTLRHNKRTLLKADHTGEEGPRSVQILGNDPRRMADAALYTVDQGAQIIDINMGCPAKKVCSVAAGSALLKNETLVGEILSSVVGAVTVPVTLKIRTGWDTDNRNAITIARIAESAGVTAVTVHGRTRACGFAGVAEYETIRAVKKSVRIPVIANGDIDSPKKAKDVLHFTGADGIMIACAAQGRPWLFREISGFLNREQKAAPVTPGEIHAVMARHMEKLYEFYGHYMGARIARKHIGWYLKTLGGIPAETLRQINKAEHPKQQQTLVNNVFDLLLSESAA
ncbi:MAG: tRNA dihydrouridine synthase DusB [Pseudomonadota bacterium]